MIAIFSVVVIVVMIVAIVIISILICVCWKRGRSRPTYTVSDEDAVYDKIEDIVTSSCVAYSSANLVVPPAYKVGSNNIALSSTTKDEVPFATTINTAYSSAKASTEEEIVTSSNVAYFPEHNAKMSTEIESVIGSDGFCPPADPTKAMVSLTEEDSVISSNVVSPPTNLSKPMVEDVHEMTVKADGIDGNLSDSGEGTNQQDGKRVCNQAEESILEVVDKDKHADASEELENAGKGSK